MFYDTGPRMDKKFYDTGHTVYLSMRAISKRSQPICTSAFHGATTFSMTTLGIPTLSIMKLILTLSMNDSQPRDTQFQVSLCSVSHFVGMLSSAMLTAVAPLSRIWVRLRKNSFRHRSTLNHFSTLPFETQKHLIHFILRCRDFHPNDI
jgi:hypothetical protein